LLVILVSATMVLSLCIGEEGGDLLGAKAPGFTVLDVDDITHNLSDYRGQVLVVEFFATWCTFCAAELEVLLQLREELNESEVAFLSIDTDDRESQKKVMEYRDKKGITWPVAYNSGKVGEKYDVDAIPTTIIIDQKGIVREYRTGVSDPDELRETIEGFI
jgi:cytochrome c-type biogenesis protein